MAQPNIWTVDIETSPNLAYKFDTFQTNISPDKIVEPVQMMCFAAKRYDRQKIEYWSRFKHGEDQMIARAFEIIEEADIIIHYNGKRFDVPHLKREFLLRQFGPPAPIQQIDLYQVVKSNFKFPSNKLDYVARQLGVEGKVQHTGFDLWLRCLQNDPDAWRLMEKYNKQDVKITEKVYDKLRPWMTNHPNMNLFLGLEDGCPNCGSNSLQRRGSQLTTTKAYWRYQCTDCGAWSRLTKSDKEASSTTRRSVSA